MRTTSRLAALAVVGALLAACTPAGTSPSPSSPAASTPASSPSSAASQEPSPSAAACAAESLPTKQAGQLTVGTDNPAYPPYFEAREGGNTEPWDPDGGDPTTGEGFESAVAYAIAEELGFDESEVSWIVVPFNESFAPGPKDFDIFINQVGFKEERTQGADLSESYYLGNQTIVTMADSDFADATTVTEFKDATLGAQVGTTSLATIEDVVQTTAEAAVYNTTDDAIEDMQNGQIDGIVVDLPTAWFITTIQIEGATMVGQLGDAAGGQPERFSVVLELDSPLTDCVNAAITALTDDGTIDALSEEWLPFTDVPELQP